VSVKKTMNITSSDRLWTPASAGANALNIHQALAELAANSIDWSLLSKGEQTSLFSDAKAKKPGAENFLKSLTDKYGNDLALITSTTTPTSKVEIRVTKDSYEIVDNGVGMIQKELEDALILRGASNQTRPNLRPRKGKFGMGMKSGMLNLGWRITIWTRSVLNPGTELMVDIDCRLIDSGKLKLEAIPFVEEKCGKDKNSPLHVKDLKHGTAIRIGDLVNPPGGPTYIAENLGSNFSPDIESKVTEIFVTDAKTDPTKPTLAQGGACKGPVNRYDPNFKMIKVDDLKIEITPDEGGAPVLLRGWIRLLEKGRPGGDRKFGLDLYRHGQLIEAHHNRGGKPGLWPAALHTNHTRIVGVLHLDMCSPNYTKVGWDTRSPAWQEVKKKLKPHLAGVKKTAGQVKAGTPPVSLLKAWEALFSATKSTISKTAKASKAGTTTGTTPVADKSKFEEKTIRLKDGRPITIAAIQELSLSTKEPWTHMFDDTKNELVIYYNTDSVLYKQYAEAYKSKPGTDQTKMLSAWAIFDSLFIVLTKPGGHFELSIPEAMEYRSEWLSVVFEDSSKEKVTSPKAKSKGAKVGKAPITEEQPTLSSIGQVCLKVIMANNLSIVDGLKEAGITKTTLEDCSQAEHHQLMQYFRKKSN